VRQRSSASKKNYIPDEVEFQTKQQIAISLVRRALNNGIRVKAWTFDEAYGRDHKFLDDLETLKQKFVGEVPSDFHGWAVEPIVRTRTRKGKETRGRKHKAKVIYPKHSSTVENLAKYSPALRDKSWQRYRIKDTNKGPDVWEVKWCSFWRKVENADTAIKRKHPSKRHCLLIARNVETGEIKYFVSNMVPGHNGVTVRDLLRIAFSRWSVEACFRTAKEELGMDHFEVRGWRCVHRHWYITQLAQLFCSRMRQEFDPDPTSTNHTITVEQVRSAVNQWLASMSLPTSARNQRLQTELDRQAYHKKRNATARKSHTKTQMQKLINLGIDPDRIKSCIPKDDLP
jgi:SRSO17 transposase